MCFAHCLVYVEFFSKIHEHISCCMIQPNAATTGVGRLFCRMRKVVKG